MFKRKFDQWNKVTRHFKRLPLPPLEKEGRRTSAAQVAVGFADTPEWNAAELGMGHTALIREAERSRLVVWRQ
ncbi:hypothetical protein [Burkholderia cepacia]|uniref:hypothetical protein n=1 Tax=Burkholderia cepacia TaxID=292 RepID=UPI001CF2F1EF|nr:hypothetical protein [Burkholderia cepacia]MCA8395781.1 hypothetical protein [Burkholderia cepacia]